MDSEAGTQMPLLDLNRTIYLRNSGGVRREDERHASVYREEGEVTTSKKGQNPYHARADAKTRGEPWATAQGEGNDVGKDQGK